MRKSTLLIADDDELLMKLLTLYAEDMGLEVIQCFNGKEAIDKVHHQKPDIILLDMQMPILNGLEVLTQLKSSSEFSNIPVLILTGLNERKYMMEAYKLGVYDFLSKPLDSEIFQIRLRNALKIKLYEDSLETAVNERTNSLNEAIKEVQESHDQLAKSYKDTIKRLAILSEFRDEDTGDHILRIGDFSRTLGSLANIEGEQLNNIYFSSILHDIGKVGIPDTILLKKGPLDQEEWAIMKSHTTIGRNILSDSASPLLKTAARIASSHHEYWNGSGYPEGLIKDEIPLEARLVSIVDTYDALRSTRPYKEGFSHDRTMDILKKGDGRTVPEQFDPELLSLFLSNESLFCKIYDDSISQKKLGLQDFN